MHYKILQYIKQKTAFGIKYIEMHNKSYNAKVHKQVKMKFSYARYITQ